MTIRELIKKPFLTPSDLSKIAGISVTSARKKIELIRSELSDQGFININNSKVPTKVLIERLNIDIDWLEKVGGLDKEF
jgi:hypothetical protein